MLSKRLVKICFVLVFLVSVMVPVYALFIKSWEAPISLNITSPDIKVYWDVDATNPVTSINLGSLQQGTKAYYKTLYIKNEGTGTVKLEWNSNLSLVTTTITEHWQWYYDINDWERGYYDYDLNGYFLDSGETITTYYVIDVKTTCPIGSYEWTLNLGVQE